MVFVCVAVLAGVRTSPGFDYMVDISHTNLLGFWYGVGACLRGKCLHAMLYFVAKWLRGWRLIIVEYRDTITLPVAARYLCSVVTWCPVWRRGPAFPGWPSHPCTASCVDCGFAACMSPTTALRIAFHPHLLFKLRNMASATKRPELNWIRT